MPVGSASNNEWTVRPTGEVDTYDGQGGMDTLSFGRLSRSDFVITRNLDGTVSVESIAGAAAYFRLRLINIELLRFNNGTTVLDLRTIQAAPDVSAPRLTGATVSFDGSLVVLSYSELLSASNLPPASAYTVTADGVAITPASLAVSGASVTLTLPAGSVVHAGQFVTIAYADPTTANDTVAIQDAGGNDAASVAAFSASNASQTLRSEILGTAQAERLTGSTTGDRLSGGEGHDTLVGLGGNDIIDGGAGMDIAVFSGRRADYRVTVATDGSATVVGPDGADRVVDVERLRFDDRVMALDHDGTAGKVYRLYQAAFDRKPDAAGLGFWIESLDRGFELKQAADNFLQAPEFTALYGQNPSNDQFVTLLYRHVHHREPDAAGKQFWLDALANKDGAFGRNWSRGEVLLQFAESAENRAALIGVMLDGFEYEPFHAFGG